MNVPRRRGLVGPTAVALGLLLAACGSDSAPSATDRVGPVRVVAGFYPLAWMAEQVGGERVRVSNLTRPGAEPHDLEITPAAVADVADADVLVYLAGFQPAVDDAVSGSGATAFDATEAADLTGAADRHFWLDPIRLGAVARAFADTLIEVDPRGAEVYRANADTVTAQLDRLDREYQAVLSGCAADQLVTSHEAFGYLAARYGLEQVGIAGVSPGQEPTAADLARLADFVRDHRVRTVYVEALVSPAVAETVAAESGARTAVLDPIEGLTDAAEGRDYLQIMRSNLEALEQGQPCP